MTFQVKSEILLNNSNWEKNLRKSSKQLAGFGKSMKTVSNGIKAAWAGVAVVAFGAVGDAIVEVTKAFQEDQQSQRVLAAVVENNVKGHKRLKSEIEGNISAWQTMSNVQDDKIRPAYAYLIRATKSVTKSNKLMQISLDLAAGANIDLKAAASAVGRAYTGNLMALNKLAPGIKKLKDPLGEVAKRFKGLAALQADNDPFAQMTIVMDEFKERLGKSFLPLVKSFAKFMQSEQFQKGLDSLVAKVEKFGEWFASKKGQETFKQWMSDLKIIIKLAADFLGLVANVASLFDQNLKDRTFTEAAKKTNGLNYLGGGQTKFLTTPTMPLSGNMSNVTMNITVNGAVSGNDVVKALKNVANTRGVSLGQLLR